MKELEKLFNEILLQLKGESKNIKDFFRIFQKSYCSKVCQNSILI